MRNNELGKFLVLTTCGERFHYSEVYRQTAEFDRNVVVPPRTSLQ